MPRNIICTESQRNTTYVLEMPNIRAGLGEGTRFLTMLSNQKRDTLSFLDLPSFLGPLLAYTHSGYNSTHCFKIICCQKLKKNVICMETFKIFYLFIETERERERQKHRQREKQAPCREPDVGLHPRSPGPRLRLQVALNRCATGAALDNSFKYQLVSPSGTSNIRIIDLCLSSISTLNLRSVLFFFLKNFVFLNFFPLLNFDSNPSFFEYLVSQFFYI